MACGCKKNKTPEQPNVPQITKKQVASPPPPKIVRENNNNNIVQPSNNTLIDKIVSKLEDISQSH